MRCCAFGVIALLMTLSGSAQALDQCAGRNINNFVVGSISLDHQSISQGIGRILKGTPYRVDVQPGVKKFITMKNVSGPLGGILRKIAEQSGLEINRDGCRLVVYDPDAEKIDQNDSDDEVAGDMVGEIKIYAGEIDIDDL